MILQILLLKKKKLSRKWLRFQQSVHPTATFETASDIPLPRKYMEGLKEIPNNKIIHKKEKKTLPTKNSDKKKSEENKKLEKEQNPVS